MARPSLARVIDESGIWEQRDFSAAVAPSTVAPSNTNFDTLDIGTIAPSTKASQVGLTLKLPDNFDDSIYDVKIYALNIPEKSGVNFAILTGAAAVFGATATEDLITTGGGINIACALDDAAWLTSALYDPVDNRIQEIILQLQAGSTPLIWGQSVWDQERKVHAPPSLQLWVIRTDDDTYYAPDSLNSDEVRAHMFSMSDVGIYYVRPDGCEEYIGGVADDTIEIESYPELADYTKGMPKSTLVQAKISTMGSVNFTLASITTGMLARLLHTSVTEDAANYQNIISNNSVQEGIREGKFIVRWRTLGNYLCQFVLGRATLRQTGPWVPAQDGFGSVPLTLTGLADGCKRGVSEYRVSTRPMQKFCELLLDWEITL